MSRDATLGERAVAGVSLATEIFSPVTTRDAQAGLNAAENALQARRATNRTLDFANDTDGFVDDVMAFNRTTDGGGNLFSGDIHSIMQSASYYETPAEQAASIFRSIIKNHTFENGNKRTAVAAYTAFAERVGLPVNLSHNQLMDITLRVERNELVDVSDIANALR